jgi:hypothetical protein
VKEREPKEEFIHFKFEFFTRKNYAAHDVVEETNGANCRYYDTKIGCIIINRHIVDGRILIGTLG